MSTELLLMMLAGLMSPGEPPVQVTSVAGATDLSPNDWPVKTLGRLINRYGCSANGAAATFRGNRPMTRYEFAAGYNACADFLNARIAEAQGPNSQDADDMRTLAQQFAPELQALGGRVNALDGRTNQLESQQFNPTSKLDPNAPQGPGAPVNPRAGRRPRPPQ